MNISEIQKFEKALYEAKTIVSTYTERGRVAGLCNTIHINDFKENFNVENEFGLRYIPNFYWLEDLYFSDFVPKGYIYVCPIEGTNIVPSWGGAYTALTKVVSIKGLKETEQDESDKSYWKSIATDVVCSNCGFSCNDEWYLGKALFCPECGKDMTKFGVDSEGNAIQADKNGKPLN